ncbi:MAG: aminoacyl-histidine dipeptidase [Alistipes sp.]|nr:aminoacyl-histidine dipeptidase [Candidatus Alistipes equi]
MNLGELNPSNVWKIFDQITKVPRPSKHEEHIREYLINFAASHSIECKCDEIGNVVMRIPASKGMEEAPAVILQAHMDMVCEKNSAIDFDFRKDAIRTKVEDGWVKAEGTTLGADDGIGIALALAVLTSQDVKHGPLEALFTVDEETGLTGAFALGKDMIHGKYLINLDSEDEGEICIGCAGGIDTVATMEYTLEEVPATFEFLRISVSKLQGGHSGDDINKGRANAVKILSYILWQLLLKGIKLCDIQAGNLRNAIPREGYAVIAVPKENVDAVKEIVKEAQKQAYSVFSSIEPSLSIECERTLKHDSALPHKNTSALLMALLGVQNDVVRMSAAIEGLVETSTNLASVKVVEPGKIVVATSQRSSVEGAKKYIASQVEAIFKLAGMDVKHSDGYPGWTPIPTSSLVKVMRESYCRLYGKEPLVRAIHAGLECGLFLTMYPELEMASIGPTMRGVHSPDERLEIKTVAQLWEYLSDILASLK